MLFFFFFLLPPPPPNRSVRMALVRTRLAGEIMRVGSQDKTQAGVSEGTIWPSGGSVGGKESAEVGCGRGVRRAQAGGDSGTGGGRDRAGPGAGHWALPKAWALPDGSEHPPWLRASPSSVGPGGTEMGERRAPGLCRKQKGKEAPWGEIGAGGCSYPWLAVVWGGSCAWGRHRGESRGAAGMLSARGAGGAEHQTFIWFHRGEEDGQRRRQQRGSLEPQTSSTHRGAAKGLSPGRLPLPAPSPVHPKEGPGLSPPPVPPQGGSVRGEPLACTHFL